jgi:hypothetical protein
LSSVDRALAPDDGARPKFPHADLVKATGVLAILIALGAWYAWRSYAEAYARVKFAQVLGEGAALEADAAREFSAAPGPSAASDREVRPALPYVRRIVVSPVRRSIVLWLQARVLDEPGVAEGAMLRLTLVPGGSAWTCSTEGIPSRYVPVPCRH